jgi:hypothetical protein
MGTITIVIGLIILVIVVLVVHKVLTIRKQKNKLNKGRFGRIMPLYNKLESGETLTTDDILPYAKNLLTRETTFKLLNDYNKTDLFPQEYFTIIKGAESNLANWLLYPTELDACPDDMEHIKRVTFDFDGQNNFVHYEVFKYRVNEPHWAAKSGWILGVVGPFFDDSKPYHFPGATFSRISSTVDKVSPEEEANWVHKNIGMRQ